MTTAPDVQHRFAEQLEAAMNTQQLRRWMIAERAGMTAGQVADILTLRYPDARLSTLCRLAAAAGCEIDIIVKPGEST